MGTFVEIVGPQPRTSLDTIAPDGVLATAMNPRLLASEVEQVVAQPGVIPAYSYFIGVNVVLAQADDGWRMASLGLQDGEIPEWL